MKIKVNEWIRICNIFNPYKTPYKIIYDTFIFAVNLHKAWPTKLCLYAIPFSWPWLKINNKLYSIHVYINIGGQYGRQEVSVIFKHKPLKIHNSIFQMLLLLRMTYSRIVYVLYYSSCYEYMFIRVLELLSSIW